MEAQPPSLSDRPAPLPARLRAALGGRSVLLVGMPGCGKSTIGRRLARVLELPFRDADTEIETAAGMSIPEIFAKHGEPHFRAGEARVIARLLDSGPLVIATGGGAWMNAETRAKAAGQAVSLWLKASPEVLLERVKRRQNRPLLKDNPEKALRDLLAVREPVYGLADITILSADVAHEEVVNAAVSALAAHLDLTGAEP